MVEDINVHHVIGIPINAASSLAQRHVSHFNYYYPSVAHSDSWASSHTEGEAPNTSWVVGLPGTKGSGAGVWTGRLLRIARHGYGLASGLRPGTSLLTCRYVPTWAEVSSSYFCITLPSPIIHNRVSSLPHVFLKFLPRILC